jgi:hypothetical protein
MSYSLAGGNEKYTHNFGGKNFLKSGILGRPKKVEDNVWTFLNFAPK